MADCDRPLDARRYTVVIVLVRAANQLLMLLPNTLTTLIIKIAMSATSRPYSVTAMASSERKKRRTLSIACGVESSPQVLHTEEFAASVSCVWPTRPLDLQVLGWTLGLSGGVVEAAQVADYVQRPLLHLIINSAEVFTDNTDHE